MNRPHRIAAAFFLLVIGSAAVHAADDEVMPFCDYRTESWFLPQSPSVTGGPAAALFNPAAWAANDRSGSDSWSITPNEKWLPGAAENSGMSMGKTLGMAMQTRRFRTSEGNRRVYDYQLGLARGSRELMTGVAYRWSQGDVDVIPRQRAGMAGVIYRRRSWLTAGLAGIHSFESEASQGILDLGLRPFSRPALTLFADWTFDDRHEFLDDGSWSAGCEVRPVSGVHLGFRARERFSTGRIDYSVVMGLTWGTHNYTFLPVFDRDGGRMRAGLVSRSGPPFRGFPLPMPRLRNRGTRYFPLNLENRTLTYQRYRYGDKTRVAWLDLLRLLDRLEQEDTVSGVAVNLAGFRGRPSLLWELRRKLARIQATGKEIVVHVDRPSPNVFYLATVADRITLDPWGTVLLPGNALGRSYLQGTLEKLGVGFQELRYFEYKSAAETFARRDMSPADREQRQRIVDVIYEELRDGVSSGRELAPGRYDEIVDEMAVLSPAEAAAAGLVDTVGRWDDLSEWLHKERDAKLWSGKLPEQGRVYHDEQWGPPMKIPVVYAVGTCAMDSGIKGRRTSAYLRSLIGDDGVAAVVLRADSPGGDPLPSDLVADAVRRLREAGKPVIVSQGDVAASGGYWISMDGAEILTTPLTITGSIGVIAGWIWDEGLADKLGVTADAVQRGRHADLLTRVNLPFLGGIPRRPLNEEELTRAEAAIRNNYDQFVTAVATGRDLPPERVEAVAQGRVWMGGDAVERGLCDRFGGLDDAIDRARILSGVADWREVEIVEFPPRPLIEWPQLLPSFPSFFGLGDAIAGLLPSGEGPSLLDGGEVESMPAALAATGEASGLSVLDLTYLQTIGEAAARPLLLIEPDLLPQEWRELD